MQEWLWAGVCWLTEVTMTSLLHLYLTFLRSLHPLLATASSHRPCLATCDPWKPWKRKTMSHLLEFLPATVSLTFSFILLWSSLPHFLLLFFFLHTHMFTHSQTLWLQSLTYHICWVNHSIPAFSIFLNVPDTLGLFIKGLKWYQVELKFLCFQMHLFTNRHRYS